MRSASCRSTVAAIAACSASTSSAPDNRNAIGMFSAPDVGSKRLRNRHALLSRRQRDPVGPRERAQFRPESVRADSARAASAAAVGCSNSSRMPSAVPSTALTRAMSRVASSELPPRSKKLSSTDTRSRPSSSANTPTTFSSTGFDGARNSRVETNSGTGSARRSSLPPAVTGSRSSTTTWVGTM
ncbi:hypothetical protein P9209_24095 [Prescottella defluvii]|nr:hypothetical protein P9209_24095 [Prescottella defluvii]